MLSTTPSKEYLPAGISTPNLKLLQVTIDIFLENTEEFFASYLEKIGRAWWVEIVTKKPDCIYYFGPFVSHREAQISQLGYIEDLERERPQLIAIEIKQCQPKELTFFEDTWRETIDTCDHPSKKQESCNTKSGLTTPFLVETRLLCRRHKA